MAVKTFIPEIWSARLQNHLDKSHVFANLVNRYYEGEIKDYGDTVKIGRVGNVSVKEYTRNQNIAAADQLNMEQVVMKIDQAQYYNFYIDDVDNAQIRTPIMDKAMQRAAYALSDTIDNYLAKIMKDNIGSNHTGGSESAGGKITAANVYQKLVDLKVKMDTANIPSIGRFIVVPPEFEGLMLMDTRFAGAYSSKSEGALTNGFIGRAVGFDIYVSNNCPKSSNTYACIASIKDSTTFAEQVTKTEAYRPQSAFSDAIKGLAVYGAKVTEPKMVFGIYADFTE